MSNQIPDKHYVFNALLRYNYLPIGKKYPDDIPFPAFSTEDLHTRYCIEMLERLSRAILSLLRSLNIVQSDLTLTRLIYSISLCFM